jgi:hypothetical protein
MTASATPPLARHSSTTRTASQAATSARSRHRLVQVALVVERDRLEERDDPAVDGRHRDRAAQQPAASSPRGHHQGQPGDVAQRPIAWSLWKWPPNPFW